MLMLTAIDLLRPTLPRRDTLRQSIIRCHNSWFCTLPKEMRDKIIAYIPSLRQTYTKIALQAVAADRLAFLSQYGTFADDTTSDISYLMDHKKFTRDFPEVKLTVGLEIIICIKKYKHPQTGRIRMLVGHNGSVAIYENGKMIKQMDNIGSVCIYRGVHVKLVSAFSWEPMDSDIHINGSVVCSGIILPCGLILHHAFDQNYLFDPISRRSIHVDHEYKLVYYDDHGNACDLFKYSEAMPGAMCWSNMTSNLPLFKVC